MLDQSVRKGSTKSSLSQGSWVAMGNCRSGLHVCTQSCKVRPDTWNHGNLPSTKVAKSCKDTQFWSISLRKRVTVDGSATCCYSWETLEDQTMALEPLQTPRIGGEILLGHVKVSSTPGGAPSQTASTLRTNVAAFEHESIHLMDSIGTYFSLFSAVCFKLKFFPQKPQLGRQLPCPVSRALALQGRAGILSRPVFCIASRPFG